MIEAIIHYQDSTLIMDLPRNIYDIHEKLMSIGCPTAPGRIPLTDNEDDALRVKLYGRIEILWRCHSAKDRHHRPDLQEAKGKRRRGTHVACGEQPSGHRYS